MSSIREQLGARGLRGDDLLSMLDYFLTACAKEYAFWTTEEIIEEFGSNTSRLVMALRAIGKESTDET